MVRRYKCVTCRRSFRVHPTGVSRHQRSQRLRGIGVLLYVLGLSYGGVADALAALSLADLEELQLLIALRPPDGALRLAGYLRRYQAAPPPAKGEKASLWYRFRLALLRWANAWRRLVYDLTWNRTHATQPNVPHLDGTNNVAERAIGWWIKDRYRAMRTFKRRASVRNLARLIPFLAAHPDQPCLTHLLAA